GRPVGRAALAGLLGEPASSEPVLHDQLAAVWRRLGERLQLAVDAGEIRGDLDLDAHIGALAGPAMLAAIVHGEAAITDERVGALTSVALDGIRSAPGGRAGKGSGR